MGHQSLSSNTTGESNTAIGSEALNQNVTGKWNTATGYQSLIQSTGDNNVAFGFQAGKNLTSGQNNIFIGYDADAGNTNTSSTNSIVIGAETVGKGSNTVVIGNDDITKTFLKGKIDIDGAYVLPETAGNAGDVLTYPVSGNELVWGNAGTTSPWSETNFGAGDNFIYHNNKNIYIGETPNQATAFANDVLLKVNNTNEINGFISNSDGISSSSAKHAITGFISNSSGGGNNIGVKGRAQNGSGVNIGIHGSAQGTNTTNYAGYFGDGDVKIENNLEVSVDTKLSGNVGIGIDPDNTSTYKLKVNGSTKVAGDIDLPYGGNITLSDGGNITLSQDYLGFGGNITAPGDITFSLDTVSNNATSPVAMVVSNNSGSLKLMDMSAMGGHWQSNQSGDNIYVGNGKKIGIGLPNTTEKFEIAGDDNFESIMKISQYSNDVQPPTIRFTKSRGSSIGTGGNVIDGDILGSIESRGFLNQGYNSRAMINFEVDGTTSQVSKIPSRISFYTADNSQHTPSERLRITSDGKVGIGDFSQSNPAFIPQFALDINTNTEKRGIYVVNSTPSNGSSTGDAKFGIYAGASGSGTAHNYGGAFDAFGSGNGDMVGVSGYAGGANSAHNIGVEGNAIANTSGINYGVFGRAQDGGTNWAGYFASGNVKIENNLEIDGNIKITGSTHSNGAVLTSDGNGNATWQQPAGSGTSGGSNSKTFNYLSDGF